MRNPDHRAASGIDNYDMAILAALSDNAELTTIELSKLVHLSRTAVSRRITALKDRGVLAAPRYDVHYHKLGFAIRAYVSVSAPDADSFDVLRRILQKPEVLDVSVVLGEELLLVEVVAVDTAHLHQFLTWINDIGHTETKVILKKHRSPIDFRTRMRMVEDELANPDPRLVSAAE